MVYRSSEVFVATRCLVLAALAVALPLLAGAAVAAPAGERALQLDAQVEAGLEQAVAYVAVEYQKPNSTRRCVESGTGFFVTPTHLITNHHVVAAAVQDRSADLTVRIFSGTRDARVLPVEIVRTDAKADLALLRVTCDLPAIKPVRIHPDLPGKQSEVYAFGFPLGTMLDRSLNGPNVCLRRGYVSRTINDGKGIECDLNIDKGLSGGPLVDDQGTVRGVVRAMAGSDFNQGFAALAVSSPVLLDFCQASGVAITLADGKLLEPSQQPVTPPTTPVDEPAPRPRVAEAEDTLRSFFAIGAALRLSALVPGILTLEKADYTPDLRQTSRGNADLALANLRRVEAPSELVQRARELSLLLTDAQTQPATAREKSAVLEEACDEWTRDLPDDERLNYDLAAWLTELSLGVLDAETHKDSRFCVFFLSEARRAEATAEIIEILTRLQEKLATYEKTRTDELRRAIGKEADRLIGIGVLATINSGRNPIEKAPTEPPDQSSPRNPIRYPL